MSFNAEKENINDILRNSIFSIPRNQRRYVWVKDNWEDLFSDVIFSIKSQKSHFIGSIVLESNGEKNGLLYYTIIDGQQRLITIIMALISIMKLFSEHEMNDAFFGTINYLKSKDNRNNDIINLKSDYHLSIERFINSIVNLDDKNISFASFINTNTVSRAKDKNVIDAVKYFYTVINKEIESFENQEEQLIKIRDAIINMTVVKIVSNSEDSYTIFEILNARGQDLEDSELIKNYIMRYIYPEENRDLAKLQWEQMENVLGTSTNIKHFFSHYVIHKYNITSESRISPYHIIQKSVRGEAVKELLDDMILKSNYYEKIINPQNGENGNCEIYEADVFSFFKKRKVEQFRPVLLSIINQKERENISNEKYEMLIKYLYIFYVCYAIIGEEKSNKLPDIVRKYAPLIENNCSNEIIDEFAISLKRKIPGYDWFLNCFKNIGWSKHFDIYKGEKNKQRVQIILQILEDYISQTKCDTSFTIEHMLPDNESIDNSQIGNLIPLEESLNGFCGSKPLMEKYETYYRSRYFTTRNIADRIKNDNFDANKRTAYLARLIYNNILELNQLDFSNE